MASDVLQVLRPRIISLLVAVNEHCFDEAQEVVSKMREILTNAREKTEADDHFLTDMYVLDRYVDLMSGYSLLWKKIINQEFSASWDCLQENLNLLRSIKRFSQLDVSFFENQLVELEQAYPYNVFFSIGVTVEHFECSICGRDIDSDECPHMRGRLYAGKMAHAIARDITNLDHVSIVTNPEDKRCVVEYPDTGKQFRLVRYLSGLITSRKLRISDFDSLKFTKRQQRNPNYVELGRNDPCFCGSDKKFKKCCISKRYIGHDHVDVVAKPRSMEEVIT